MKDQKGETMAASDEAASVAAAEVGMNGDMASELGLDPAASTSRDPSLDSGATALDAEASSPAPSNEELAGERILELEAEVKSLQDQVLRTHADMENLRRRTEREMRDARAYAISKFAKEVLGVADNLERALTALPNEARASGDTALLSLIEGIELTQRELVKALEKQGVEPILADQARFDPNLHQAMFEVPNPDVPNNTVVQVVQTGYTIGERVLRPAMVGVAKGGPKIAANAAKDTPAEAGPDTPPEPSASPGASIDRTA